ncbi:MAG TPA: winged helix-turn-helix domain-containing protein [Sulfolobales archaeon]|nr:winged helix-turn-helix domain-containing protein [Sulfolobales archaeon]
MQDDDWKNHNYSRATGNTGNTDGDILKKMLMILSDDPRIRILKLLAEPPTNDVYVSFRTIARRIGINYNKLRQYLSQLEAVGLVESVRIRSINSNNNNNRINDRGYTYYKLRQGVRDMMRKALNLEKIIIYYPYFLSLAVGIMCFYI